MDDEKPRVTIASPGRDIAEATLRVLASRLGGDFAGDVYRAIATEADRFAAVDDDRAQSAAADMRDTLKLHIWRDLGVTTG